MRCIFIDGEARSFCRQLEEHAAGFFEVHRLEPEAIDRWCRMSTGGFDARTHRRLMLLVIHTPREMMDAADAPCAPASFRRLADVDDTRNVAKAIARPAV